MPVSSARIMFDFGLQTIKTTLLRFTPSTFLTLDQLEVKMKFSRFAVIKEFLTYMEWTALDDFWKSETIRDVKKS